MPVPKAEPLLVLDALHSTPVRRYLSAERVPMGLLPRGYPARGRWAQPDRRPAEEVVHWNRWGATATAADHPRFTALWLHALGAARARRFWIVLPGALRPARPESRP